MSRRWWRERQSRRSIATTSRAAELFYVFATDRREDSRGPLFSSRSSSLPTVESTFFCVFPRGTRERQKRLSLAFTSSHGVINSVTVTRTTELLRFVLFWGGECGKANTAATFAELKFLMRRKSLTIEQEKSVKLKQGSVRRRIKTGKM